jgi:hypothetical protein
MAGSSSGREEAIFVCISILKLTIPAHSPIKRSTLSHILKQARLTTEEFESLL